MQILTTIAGSSTTATLNLAQGATHDIDYVKQSAFRLFDPSGSFISTATHMVTVVDRMTGIALGPLWSPTQLKVEFLLRIEPLAPPKVQVPLPQNVSTPAMNPPTNMHHQDRDDDRLADKRSRKEDHRDERRRFVGCPSRAALAAFETRLLEYYREENALKHRDRGYHNEERRGDDVVRQERGLEPYTEPTTTRELQERQQKAQRYARDRYPESLEFAPKVRQTVRDAYFALFLRNGNQPLSQTLLTRGTADALKEVASFSMCKQILRMFSDPLVMEQHFIDLRSGRFVANENQGYFAGRLVILIQHYELPYDKLGTATGSLRFPEFARKCTTLPHEHPYAFAEATANGIRKRSNMSKAAQETFTRCVGGFTTHMQERPWNIL